ncbi:hypothetical protein ACDX78_06500 [Virgibacillus oceani]
MNAWLALTKKEFRLGLPAFLVALILFAGVVAGGYFFGNYIGYEQEFLTAAFIIIVMLHVFSLMFYSLYSLNVERKRLHLWLHTPMPIAGLLISKLVTGIVFKGFTFIIAITSLALFFNHHYDIFNEQTIANIVGLISISIFVYGLSIAITFIFFWSIFLTLSKRMNDFLSFILTFIVFLIMAWAYDKFIHLAFMETLTNWGAIQLKDITVEFEFSIVKDAFEVETISEASVFYIGHFVRELIVTVIMFITACWIIEKKAEV